VGVYTSGTVDYMHSLSFARLCALYQVLAEFLNLDSTFMLSTSGWGSHVIHCCRLCHRQKIPRLIMPEHSTATQTRTRNFMCVRIGVKTPILQFTSRLMSHLRIRGA